MHLFEKPRTYHHIRLFHIHGEHQLTSYVKICRPPGVAEVFQYILDKLRSVYHKNMEPKKCVANRTDITVIKCKAMSRVEHIVMHPMRSALPGVYKYLNGGQ